jgi:multiple sugar transport system substrate-binding protein
MDGGVLPGIIQEFEIQNPGVSVKLDVRPYLEVRSLFLYNTADAEGQPGELPDILGLDPRWLPRLLEKDLLEPIEDASSENVQDRTGEGGTRASAPWALPIASLVCPLFYRTDILEEAGFDRPPKNHAEFTAAARALTDPSSGRYGYALSLGPQDPLGVYRDVFPWLLSSGAALLSGGGPGFNHASAAEIMYFLKDLSEEGILSPGTFSKTREDRLEDFIAGRLAMMIAPVSDIKTLRASGASFGVTAVPGPVSYIGKPAAGASGWYAGALRTGRHKQEALAFIRFLASKSTEIMEALIAGDSEAPERDPLYFKVRDIYAAAETAEAYLDIPGEAALENALLEELRLMFEAGQSPDETLLGVQKKWEASLTGAGSLVQ